MPRNNLTHDDNYRGLPIRPEPELGNCLDILEAIHLRLDDMVDRHCRVFAVRFDLTLPWETGNVPHNRYVQAFADAFCRYLHGLGIDHHYTWVREQPGPDAQPHWHLLLLMDGNRTWSFYGGHSETATRLWAEALGTVPRPGLVHLCTWTEANDGDFPYVGNGGVMIRRNSPDCEAAYRLLFHRASYLAKATTKEFTPPNLRRFSASHLA